MESSRQCPIRPGRSYVILEDVSITQHSQAIRGSDPLGSAPGWQWGLPERSRVPNCSLSSDSKCNQGSVTSLMAGTDKTLSHVNLKGLSSLRNCWGGGGLWGGRAARMRWSLSHRGVGGVTQRSLLQREPRGQDPGGTSEVLRAWLRPHAQLLRHHYGASLLPGCQTALL